MCYFKIRDFEEEIDRLGAPKILEIRLHKNRVKMAFGRDGQSLIRWNMRGQAYAISLPGDFDEDHFEKWAGTGQWERCVKYDLCLPLFDG